MEWIVWRHLLGAKVGFNQSVKRFRREVFNCFCTLILCEFAECPKTVRQDLWEEFCRRAGATDLAPGAAPKADGLPKLKDHLHALDGDGA